MSGISHPTDFVIEPKNWQTENSLTSIFKKFSIVPDSL